MRTFVRLPTFFTAFPSAAQPTLAWPFVHRCLRGRLTPQKNSENNLLIFPVCRTVLMCCRLSCSLCGLLIPGIFLAWQSKRSLVKSRCGAGLIVGSSLRLLNRGRACTTSPSHPEIVWAANWQAGRFHCRERGTDIVKALRTLLIGTFSGFPGSNEIKDALKRFHGMDAATFTWFDYDLHLLLE